MMSSVVPALIAAGVALLAATLSTAVALITIRTSRQIDKDRRLQEFALGILPKRVEAYERTWLHLVKLERGEIMPAAEVDLLICGTVWMSDRLRNSVLELLLVDPAQAGAIPKVRKILLEDASINSIDKVATRLAQGRAT